MTTTSFIARRLEWQPVEHACGHFEIRLMRRYDEPVTAGSVCSTCAPQGRTIQQHYQNRGCAEIAAERANMRDGR